MRHFSPVMIAMFSFAGLVIGILAGTINRYLNRRIHEIARKDSPVVTGTSLTLQFAVVVCVLIFAATYMPFINPDDLGAGVASFAFVNLYFAAQTSLISEINKFVDNKFDGLKRHA